LENDLGHVLQTIPNSSSFSFHFSQKNQIKSILTFLHFLYHTNHILLLFKQKNSLQNKIFSLFYKTFSNFISYQSLFTIQHTNILQHNYLPNRLLIFSAFLPKFVHQCASKKVDGHVHVQTEPIESNHDPTFLPSSNHDRVPENFLTRTPSRLNT
jgi:hypothetical protein